MRERSSYILADESGPGSSTLVPVRAGVFGVIVGKERLLASADGEFRKAGAPAAEEFAGVRVAPSRLGGGFVFWTEGALYRADTFDGLLTPVVRLPAVIDAVTFGPKGVFVRSREGQRWSIDLRTRERLPLTPPGLQALVGSDDGRALAIDATGALHASVDGGERWTDVTATMADAAEKLEIVEGEPWAISTQGEPYRLASDGHLGAYRALPEETPLTIRPADPRWRGADVPLRSVFREGAALPDGTAVVIEQGDVIRLDARTGAIRSVVAGRLPPDASCQALQASGELLFACSGGGHHAAATAFVVSHAADPAGPVVEQTFYDEGRFFGSDDGGLSWDGPCSPSGAPTSPDGSTVGCVRQPGGAWRDVDLAALAGDAGAAPFAAVQWVPRADGSTLAVATLASATRVLFDTRNGTSVALPVELEAEAVARKMPRVKQGIRRKYRLGGGSAGIIDDSFTALPSGGVRGFLRRGGAVDITPDGRVTRSSFDFDAVTAGPFALGRAGDGRLFQSSDHGASWTLVADAPAQGRGVELRACSSAGCDFGAFFRVGWQADAPLVEEPRPSAPEPATLRVPRVPTFACKPRGGPSLRSVAADARSPDDLGLGATRLTLPPDDSVADFVRGTIPRGIVNPGYASASSDGLVQPLRAMAYGARVALQDERLVFQQNGASALGYERPFVFVPPFDPAAPVRKVTLPMRDILGAGRAAGMPLEDIFSDDMTEVGEVLALTPGEPRASAEIAFRNGRGLLAWTRGGRSLMGFRLPTNDGANVVAGVILGEREAAFLEIEDTGVEHVFRATPAGNVDVFEMGVASGVFPANPDTLAVSPHGDLVVLRTASGSEPASGLDPALILGPSQRPVVLAPWSTLIMADDPACAAKDGFRATLSLIAPWVAFSAPDLRARKEPMIARVRWSEARVCLEALEVSVPSIKIRTRTAYGTEAQDLPTWIVGRDGAFARIGISEGVEWRQPMECVLQAQGASAEVP